MKTFLEIVRDAGYSIIFHLAPRFANVLLFVLIGRRLGVHEAGVFTLAATYLLIFSTFLKGLDDLLVREVAQLDRDKIANHFANFLFLRIGLVIFMQAALLLLLLPFAYEPDTSRVILIVSLSLLPDSVVYVAQAVLLGRRRYRSSVVILGGMSGFKLVGGALILFNQGDLAQIAWVMVAGSLLAMIFMLLSAYGEMRPIRRHDLTNWRPLQKHWRAALSFIAITTLITFETQLDTILLSLFHNESEVGWYGAATTIAYSLIMFSQGYRYAVYPLMARYALESPTKLAELYAQSMRGLGALVLPMVIGIVVIAPGIISLIFGPDFSATILILRIISFTILFMFLNEPTIRLLLVHNRQAVISLFLLISAVLNVGLNLVLIPAWGANGAAVTRVISALSLFALCYFYARYSVGIRIKLFTILKKPVLAALIMLAVVWLAQGQSILFVIPLGAAVYLASLIILGELKRETLDLS